MPRNAHDTLHVLPFRRPVLYYFFCSIARTTCTALPDGIIRRYGHSLHQARRDGLEPRDAHPRRHRRNRHQRTRRPPSRTDARWTFLRRLHEINFGPYEGTSIRAFADDNIKAAFKDPTSYVPRDGGEAFAAVEERLRSFLDEVCRHLTPYITRASGRSKRRDRACAKNAFRRGRRSSSARD